jgi:Nuclease-related domain
MNHPRRIQLRLVVRSVIHGAIACGLLLSAAAPLVEDVEEVGAGLGVLAAAFALRSRRAFCSFERYRVGAESEQRVARALNALSGDGWTVRHSVDWTGPGDIDHVIRAAHTVFAIETKTKRYTPAHLARIQRAARPLGRRHRAAPVLVMCAARRVRCYEGAVLVVSVDQLVGALRAIDAAGGRRAV